MAEDLVDSVDVKRQELEANINRLRNALQHWQKWDIDYGEFQEKLEDVTEEPDHDDLIRIRNSIDATLITDSEVHELLGSGKGVKRDRDQIAALLARRVDYVQQNLQSLQKQLDAGELELRHLTGMEDIEYHDEQGLPITEILEELDDDGNVLSGKTSTTKEAAAGVAGLLSKAGIKNWSDPSPASGSTSSPSDNQLSGPASTQADATSPASSKSASAVKDPVKPSKRKKSVAFAANLDIAPAAPVQGPASPTRRTSSPPLPDLPPTPIKSRPSVPWEVAEARKGRFHSGTRVIELDENDNEVGSLPVVPPDDFQETEEEARLRREMTQYALNEVGAIVAEMDIEEGSDYDSYDDDDDDDNDNAELGEAEPAVSDDEDENEFGMTAFNRISDEDRKQMLELEQKLKARVMHNVGPDPSLDDMDVDANDVRRLVIKKGDADEDGGAPRRSSKVHFAEDAEVLPALATKDRKSGSVSLVERIVERKPGMTDGEASTSKKSKPSRSRSAMASKKEVVPEQGTPSIPIHMREESELQAQQKPDTPTGPAGQILSSTILERPARPGAVVPPSDNGTDPVLARQQLAVENRRLFNKMVQQQGGFKPTPEDEDNPLMEDKDGKVRKVSRFKAARINAGGIS